MELKATNHSYYCNDSNYFSSEVGESFDTWSEFKSEWLDEKLSIDHDYNHCFRFDINPLFDPDLDIEYDNRFSLHLYMMLQRKGIFIPIVIEEIFQEDMAEIKEYLHACWGYLQGQWEEFSEQVKTKNEAHVESTDTFVGNYGRNDYVEIYEKSELLYEEVASGVFRVIKNRNERPGALVTSEDVAHAFNNDKKVAIETKKSIVTNFSKFSV